MQTIYLVNEHDAARTTSETPYFCYSHLLMKINVGATDPEAQVPVLAAARTLGTLQQDAFLPPDLFKVRTPHAVMWQSLCMNDEQCWHCCAKG